MFGDVLVPPAGAPAAWITEEIAPVPKNIYGMTKAAAEDLCQLFHRNHNLACIVLRRSRFFPEEDDNQRVREAYSDASVKANEYLYRRVDIEDDVSAHLLASEHATSIGFRKYIISATTPFRPEDLADLRVDARECCESASWNLKPNMSDEAGTCSRALNGCTSTSVLELNWVGRRDMTSNTSSIA